MASNHSRPDLAGTAAAPASWAPERAILFLDFARVSERVPLVSVLSSDTAEEFFRFPACQPGTRAGSFQAFGPGSGPGGYRGERTGLGRGSEGSWKEREVFATFGIGANINDVDPVGVEQALLRGFEFILAYPFASGCLAITSARSSRRFCWGRGLGLAG